MAAALKPNVYYVLLALRAGPRHGLAITRDVLKFSDGEMRLWPATLYGTLQHLSDAKWIEEIHPTDAKRRPDSSERKRYYGLTPAGRQVLDAETQRLTSLVQLARRVARKSSA